MSIQHAAAFTSPKPSKAKSSSPNKGPTSKSDPIVSALRRKSGASIDELCTLTGWQPHSVRGFLSGTVRRKLGHQVCKHRDAKGITCYAIDRDRSQA